MDIGQLLMTFTFLVGKFTEWFIKILNIYTYFHISNTLHTVHLLTLFYAIYSVEFSCLGFGDTVEVPNLVHISVCGHELHQSFHNITHEGNWIHGCEEQSKKGFFRH